MMAAALAGRDTPVEEVLHDGLDWSADTEEHLHCVCTEEIDRLWTHAAGDHVRDSPRMQEGGKPSGFMAWIRDILPADNPAIFDGKEGIALAVPEVS
jgi:hypothetical protein